MAATYEKIGTTTLSSASPTISFTSIVGTYTDLRLVMFGLVTAGSNVDVRFNSDASSNYSRTTLYADGSTVTTATSVSQTTCSLNGQGGTLQTTQPFLITADIFSYAGSTYKTILSNRSSDYNGSGKTGVFVNLWRSTSAITQIDIIAYDNWDTGTTATLYGILKA